MRIPVDPTSATGPLVSVIVRAYNRANTIGRALESIFRQTYERWEIIVVDDGSTDETLKVVRSFGNLKMKSVKHGRNRGVGAAANSGIASARGELIAFLDSDDEWKCDKLALTVNFLHLHPEVDLVFHDTEILADASTLPSLIKLLNVFPSYILQHEDGDCVLTSREMYLCLLEETPIKPSALVARRMLFSSVGSFNEDCRSGEDWEYFLRAARSNVCSGFIPRSLAIQRWSHDGTYRRFFREDKKFIAAMLKSEKEKLGKDREALNAAMRGLSRQYTDLAYDYLLSGNRSSAIRVYTNAFLETGDGALLGKSLALLLPMAWRTWLRTTLVKLRQPKRVKIGRAGLWD